MFIQLYVKLYLNKNKIIELMSFNHYQGAEKDYDYLKANLKL